MEVSGNMVVLHGWGKAESNGKPSSAGWVQTTALTAATLQPKVSESFSQVWSTEVMIFFLCNDVLISFPDPSVASVSTRVRDREDDVPADMKIFIPYDSAKLCITQVWRLITFNSLSSLSNLISKLISCVLNQNDYFFFFCTLPDLKKGQCSPGEHILYCFKACDSLRLFFLDSTW